MCSTERALGTKKAKPAASTKELILGFVLIASECLPRGSVFGVCGCVPDSHIRYWELPFKKMKIQIPPLIYNFINGRYYWIITAEFIGKLLSIGATIARSLRSMTDKQFYRGSFLDTNYCNLPLILVQHFSHFVFQLKLRGYLLNMIGKNAKRLS